MRPGGRRRLLLVGMGRMGRPYLAAAHARSLDVSVVDLRRKLEREDVRALLHPGDRAYPLDAESESGWYEAARRAAGEARVDAVIGFSEPHVIPAGLVADELGLLAPGLRAGAVSRNKALQRAVFGQHGLPQPEWLVTESAQDAALWADGRFPVVGKPLSEAGSLGVRILDDRESLLEWAATAPRPFLVETCLEGPERSCELLVAEGEVLFSSLTEKVTTEPPFRVELEQYVPAPDEERVAADVTELGRSVVAALGMRTGLAHLEVHLGRDGPFLTEVAVRAAGDYILDLVGLATGVDLFDAHLAVALGERPNLRRTRAEAACAWFLTAPPGTVREVAGVERLSAAEGVERANVRAAVNDEVPPLRGSLDRLGSVLVHAPDRAELDRRVRAAKALVRIETSAGTGR